MGRFGADELNSPMKKPNLLRCALRSLVRRIDIIRLRGRLRAPRISGFLLGLSVLCAQETVLAEATQAPAVQEEFAGEIFGAKVPLSNYHFVKAAVMVFGNRWGKRPVTPQETEDVVWEQLLLSFLAFNENIEVSQEDLEAEITKIMQAEKVVFDWQKDKPQYEQWLKERTSLSPVVFEGQVKHLMQIEKLRSAVLGKMDPPVSDEEALQKFRNEHNSLSVELAQFEDEVAADEFYRKSLKGRKFWESEKKKRAQDFKRPGFVSLEFLIDLWGFPVDAAYAMMEKSAGSLYPPRPIYKGYAVFKILETRKADESEFEAQKAGCIERVKAVKKSEGLKNWIANLKEKSGLTVYVKGEDI